MKRGRYGCFRMHLEFDPKCEIIKLFFIFINLILHHYSPSVSLSLPHLRRSCIHATVVVSSLFRAHCLWSYIVVFIPLNDGASIASLSLYRCVNIACWTSPSSLVVSHFHCSWVLPSCLYRLLFVPLSECCKMAARESKNQDPYGRVFHLNLLAI